MTTSNSTVARPRWERRKDARPSELIAAALHLFIEKGYAGTRLEDVASRAGVSKGTLYLYFENKEELFKAVVRDNVVARISKSAEELLRFGGSSAAAELADHPWWRDYGSRAGGLGKLIVAESGNLPEIARFFLDEVIEPWHALLAGTLAVELSAASSAGECPDVRARDHGAAGDAFAVDAFVRAVQRAAGRC